MNQSNRLCSIAYDGRSIGYGVRDFRSTNADMQIPLNDWAVRFIKAKPMDHLRCLEFRKSSCKRGRFLMWLESRYDRIHPR